MENAEKQLLDIGFGRNRGNAVCWRTVRLDAPEIPARPAEAGVEPAASIILMRWREILARDPVASPYRISRADG